MAMLKGGVIQDILGMPGFSPYDPFGAKKGGLLFRDAPQEGPQGPSGAPPARPGTMTPPMGQQEPMGPPAQPPEPNGFERAKQGYMSYLDRYKAARDARMPNPGNPIGDFLQTALIGDPGPAREAQSKAARDAALAHLLAAGVPPEQALFAQAQAGDGFDFGDYDKVRGRDLDEARLDLDYGKADPDYLEDVARRQAAPIKMIDENGMETLVREDRDGVRPLYRGGMSYEDQDKREHKKAMVSSFNKEYDAARPALMEQGQMLQQFDNILGRMDPAGGLKSAAEFEDMADQARNLAKAFGVPLPDEIFLAKDDRALIRELDSMISVWVGNFRPPQGGVVTDADAIRFEKAVPSANWAAPENRAVLDRMREAYAQKDQYFAMKNEWVNLENGNPAEFDAMYRKLLKGEE